MADATPVVHIGENSPEQVALKLLREVMIVEGRVASPTAVNGKTPADRKYLLDTYAECLRAAKGYRTEPASR